MMNSVEFAMPEIPHFPEVPQSSFNQVKATGTIKVEIVRKDGTVEQVPLSNNGITTLGYNNMLNVHFHNDTQQSAWYSGLISDGSFSALAVGDTMASHAGWTESVAYTESTRQQWTMGSAASKSITNSSPITFTMTTDSTVIKGIFIVSVSTKSGTTGVLWATGLFSSDQTLNNGDLLKITYTVNLS